MADGRLNLVILEVRDLEAAAALYQDGFGQELRAADNGGDDGWISGAHRERSWRDGAYLHFALYQARGSGGTTGMQIGFAVDDIHAAHARATAAGARVIHDPRREPWGMTARYYDLDENIVSLTQPAPRDGEGAVPGRGD